MAKQSYKFKDGMVLISDEVITKIARSALISVEGVHLYKTDTKKGMGRIIKLEHLENKIELTVTILIKNGYKILDTAKNVQEKIKVEIETMTGISVLMVNVNVAGIVTN